jgi:lipopolysaccharide transport system ATP-binding protein
MEGVALQGRTVLFVSHNLTAVRSLCPRAILIERGRLVADGPVNQTVARYARHALEGETTGRMRVWTANTGASREPVQMLSASARPIEGDTHDAIDVATSFVIEWDYVVDKGQSVTPSMTFHDERGLLLFDQSSWDAPAPLGPGLHRTRCVVPGNLLNEGGYFVSLQFRPAEGGVLELPNVLHVDILDGAEGRHGWYGKWGGVLRVRFDWQTKRLGDGATQGEQQR